MPLCTLYKYFLIKVLFDALSYFFINSVNKKKQLFLKYKIKIYSQYGRLHTGRNSTVSILTNSLMKYLSIEEKYDPFRRHVDELHKLNSRKKWLCYKHHFWNLPWNLLLFVSSPCNKYIRGSVICFVKIEHHFCIYLMKLENRQKPELVIDIVSIVDYLYIQWIDKNDQLK